MFKKSFMKIGLVLLTISSMQGKTIDDVVENTFKKNHNIKALESSINVALEELNLSTKWANPILSYGLSDIQFDDIKARDKEPMQGQFIGISQVIPIGNKIDIKKKIAKNKYEISKYEMEDKKLQLKSKIYEFIFNIKVYKEKLELLEKYKSNTKKLEELLKELYKYNKANQVQILKTQIKYNELNLKIQDLKTMLNTLKYKLEQITYSKYSNIKFQYKIKNLSLISDVKKHPKLLSILEESKMFEEISALEKERKKSDVKVNLAYIQRHSKYEDYVNISVSVPLPILGIEDLKSRKAKFKAMEVNYKYSDMLLVFENKLEILQQNINDSQTSYNIIKKEILPKYEQLQRLIENYISLSSFKNIDSKELINNMNESIKYELKAVDEKQKYFTLLSKSIYFLKELK